MSAVRSALAEMVGMMQTGEEPGADSPWFKRAVAALESDTPVSPTQPTGSQLYAMVTRRFKSGSFPWEMVQSKDAWDLAAADLYFSPDTIVHKLSTAAPQCRHCRYPMKPFTEYCPAPVALPIEQDRADFEDWYTGHARDIKANPIGSYECALMWAAWVARSGGCYKARGGWQVSPQPWGIDGAIAAPVAALPEGWVSIEDELPDVETDVLVRGKRGDSVRHDVAGLFCDVWQSQGSEEEIRFVATHWMPIPAFAAIAQRAVSEAVPVAWLSEQWSPCLNGDDASRWQENVTLSDPSGWDGFRNARPLYTTPPAAPVALSDADQDIIAWHCVNTVTGKMLYTDSESEMVDMRDSVAKHWQITPLRVAAANQPTDADKRDAERWQSIETAPKDGQHILVWWENEARLAWWLDNSKTRTPWAGWNVPSLQVTPFGSKPTHWMPLPSEPIDTAIAASAKEAK